MERYKEYLARCTRTSRHTPEQVQEQAICREVEKYYESENKGEPLLRHKFVCCSEN